MLLKQIQPQQRILIVDINNVDFVNDQPTYLGLLDAMDKEYSYGINRMAFSEEGVFTKETS